MLLSLNTLGTGKPKIAGRKGLRATLLFLLCLSLLGLGWWFYQLSLMWFWQQDLHHKLEPVKTKQITPAPEQQRPLLISNLALPALPTLPTLAKQNSIQAASMSAAASSKAAKSKQADTIAPKQVQPQPVKIEPKEVQPQGKKVENERDAQAVLQQLQTASGLDLQIALPQNIAQRERLLGYLYRCSGVQFAVLQQQQLMYLSPKRYMPTSQWLRVVSGGLSSQEITWLGSYPGQPVRLFPQAVDQRLARYIATALQGQTLRSLRAQYILTDSGLALSHIKLNQQVISSNWLLHQSQCR
jgi:hypothetical protein